MVALAIALPFTPFVHGGQADENHSSGTPSSKDVSAKDVSSVFGNTHTADPCALTDATALRRFGDTELDRDYGNFDRCDVLVTSGDDSVVDVEVNFDGGPPPELAAPTRRVGRVGVVEERAESDACDRTLVLSGERDAFVTVTAKQTERRKAPLCAIADAATGSAVKTLNRGMIARRSPELPAASLAHQDACSLLAPSALEVVPGVDVDDPDIGFGGWDCEWGSSTRKLAVDLSFDRGQPPTAEDGTPTRLGGYRAFVQPEGDGERTCLARVVYRSYPDQNGQKAVEMLHLVVAGESSADQLCTMAQRLARSAADALRTV